MGKQRLGVNLVSLIAALREEARLNTSGRLYPVWVVDRLLGSPGCIRQRRRRLDNERLRSSRCVHWLPPNRQSC